MLGLSLLPGYAPERDHDAVARRRTERPDALDVVWVRRWVGRRVERAVDGPQVASARCNVKHKYIAV